MKLSLLALLLLPALLLPTAVPAQTGPAGCPVTEHCALLTWTPAAADADGAPSYNAYRSTGACPAEMPSNPIGLTQLNTAPIQLPTFTDSSALTSNTMYCWYVAAVQGSSLGPLISGQGTIPPFVPGAVTGFAIVLQ